MSVLRGQTALVFGASSGIGRATAVLLAKEGAAVVVAARRAEALDDLCQQIRSAGGSATAVAADVADRAQVDRAVARAIEVLGGVSVLVNTAGTNVPNRSMTGLRQQDWDDLIAVNLTGAFNTTHAVLSHMRSRRGGLIVQVSSISARWGDASGPAYQAAKAGVVGLCQGTMYEERLNGIRVSAVLPGLVDTPLVLKRPQPPLRETLDKALQPEDVAQACLFLAALPARSYVPEVVIMPPALQVIGHTSA